MGWRVVYSMCWFYGVAELCMIGVSSMAELCMVPVGSAGRKKCGVVCASSMAWMCCMWCGLVLWGG